MPNPRLNNIVDMVLRTLGPLRERRSDGVRLAADRVLAEEKTIRRGDPHSTGRIHREHGVNGGSVLAPDPGVSRELRSARRAPVRRARSRPPPRAAPRVPRVRFAARARPGLVRSGSHGRLGRPADSSGARSRARNNPLALRGASPWHGRADQKRGASGARGSSAAREALLDRRVRLAFRGSFGWSGRIGFERIHVMDRRYTDESRR